MESAKVQADLLRHSPPNLFTFLDDTFKTRKDLSGLPSLLSQLTKECSDLDRELLSLQKQLSLAIASSASRSQYLQSILGRINDDLKRFNGCWSRYSQKWCNGEVGLGAELPVLAKEVGRVETLRLYAETALQLETLVGNLEDAAFSYLNCRTRNVNTLKWKQEQLLAAAKTMGDIEKALLSVAIKRPKWSCLIKAVDIRFEKTFGRLRSQALSDHRALFSSLGWPPPFLTSNLNKEGASEVPKLVALLEDGNYKQSFLSICALQHLQSRREARHNKVLGGTEKFVNSSLWTVDELVSAIASRMEHHLLHWSDQPEFIFALVYKITRDFVGEIEESLQPLIDKAWLIGYSARETWILSMVKLLCGHLKKHTVSVLANNYLNYSGNSEVISSWLHLIDLMTAFNTKMQILASAGNPLFHFNGMSRKISLLSIFCDRIDWLHIWAEIELKDAEAKLKPELFKEDVWVLKIKHKAEGLQNRETESFLLSTSEDYKAPAIAGSVVQITWSMIERCNTLPDTLLCVQYINSSASKFLQYFFDLLLWKYQEVELTTHIDTCSLLSVVSLLNAVRYCEYVLQQWSEDNYILDMNITEDDYTSENKGDLNAAISLFQAETNYLMKLETEWLEELMAAVLREFNALSSSYVQILSHWNPEDHGEVVPNGFIGNSGMVVSAELAEALDTMKGRLNFLNMILNSQDFLDFWRSVCEGVDHYLFSSVILGRVKFSKSAISQLILDIEALFSVFQPFCARPEAFFPFISNSLKLLHMDLQDVEALAAALLDGEKKMSCLSQYEVYHINHFQAKKILKNRMR